MRIEQREILQYRCIVLNTLTPELFAELCVNHFVFGSGVMLCALRMVSPFIRGRGRLLIENFREAIGCLFQFFRQLAANNKEGL